SGFDKTDLVGRNAGLDVELTGSEAPQPCGRIGRFKEHHTIDVHVYRVIETRILHQGDVIAWNPLGQDVWAVADLIAGLGPIAPLGLDHVRGHRLRRHVRKQLRQVRRGILELYFERLVVDSPRAELLGRYPAGIDRLRVLEYVEYRRIGCRGLGIEYPPPG